MHVFCTRVSLTFIETRMVGSFKFKLLYVYWDLITAVLFGWRSLCCAFFLDESLTGLLQCFPYFEYTVWRTGWEILLLTLIYTVTVNAWTSMQTSWGENEVSSHFMTVKSCVLWSLYGNHHSLFQLHIYVERICSIKWQMFSWLGLSIWFVPYTHFVTKWILD